MPQQPDETPDGHQPLLEPAVLLSENCPECIGTGRKTTGPLAGSVCEDCDGSGRQVREVPLSEAFGLMQRSHQEALMPSPSALRDQAVRSDEPDA